MLIVVTSATTRPVTIDQVRVHCRAPENGDDDQLLERALNSAIEYLEQQTELSLQPAVFEYRMPFWPCWAGGYRRAYEIDLPRKPVRDVISIEYYDADNAVQTVDVADYSWRMTAEGASIRFKNTFSFPTLSCEEPEPVRVTFAAGYDDPAETGSGDDPNFDLPQRATAAVLLKTEIDYERAGLTEEQSRVLQSSLGALIGQLRVFR